MIEYQKILEIKLIILLKDLLQKKHLQSQLAPALEIN